MQGWTIQKLTGSFFKGPYRNCTGQLSHGIAGMHHDIHVYTFYILIDSCTLRDFLGADQSRSLSTQLLYGGMYTSGKDVILHGVPQRWGGQRDLRMYAEQI